MISAHLYNVIEASVVSEKSTLLSESNRFVFRVNKSANKYKIKSAVEAMFDVKVQSVHVINVKGKAKRFGKYQGVRSDWKKAYVKLEPGYKIDLGLQ